ncbi:MAG: hypothetical protein J6J36_07035 [Clostridia bacterium]|nr:hypothetical protein [Clostridia bacterium]
MKPDIEKVFIENWEGNKLYSSNKTVIRFLNEYKKNNHLLKCLIISFIVLSSLCLTASILIYNLPLTITTEDKSIICGSMLICLFFMVLFISRVKDNRDYYKETYMSFWLNGTEREEQITYYRRRQLKQERAKKRKQAENLVKCWNILDSGRTQKEKINLLIKYMGEQEW